MQTRETKLRRAAQRAKQAREERNQLIREASEAGMTRRAVAKATGLSFSRIQQIVGMLVLALLLLAAPASAAKVRGGLHAVASSHPTKIVVEDGSPDRPYQRWIKWARVPTPDVTIRVIEGGATSSRDHCLGDALACVSPEGWMFVATPVSRFTFRHEIGHVFAWEHLGPGRVAYFKRLLRTDAPWEIGTDGYSAPQEAFADTYATCATGSRWMPISADRFTISTRTYRRTCRMIRRAA